MNYNVNMDGTNVSTTVDVEKKSETTEKWCVDNMEKDFSVSELVDALFLVERFKRKYPNDDTFTNYEECVRYELCSMFGGKLNDED